MQSIHISTARKILDSKKPVQLCVWKTDGSILRYDCVSMHYDFYGGWRNVKLIASGQIRRVRDCCIFQLNGMEVYL